MRAKRGRVVIGLAVGLAIAVSASAGEEKGSSPAVFRDSFETDVTSWRKEYLDTTITLVAHDRSNKAAHGGARSERFVFDAENGGQFFVSYKTPRLPVTKELRIGLRVKGNQAGVRVFARVVLPADIDPETKAASFVLVPGTIYTEAERWQPLELQSLPAGVERQARVLRASTKRPIPLEGAYVEQVVVNLLAGPGTSEVFLDDLEISPAPAAGAASHTPPATAEPVAERDGTHPPRVRMQRNLLERIGQKGSYVPWFPTAILAPGANVSELRRAGFDMLWDDGTDPERLKAAVSRGFLIALGLEIGEGSDPAREIDRLASLPMRDAIAFSTLGMGLGRDRKLEARARELERILSALRLLRELGEDTPRLASAGVDGDLPLFARAPVGLDLIGIAAPAWGGSQSPLEILQYLTQRKWLTARSNLSSLFFAWIEATAPEPAARAIWGDDSRPTHGGPSVLPEQIRMQTYLALSAGYRGVGYLADADLTRPAGRINLIEMSFLNLEIDLVESILARNEEQITQFPVFDPDPPILPTNPSTTVTRPKQVKELPPKPGMLAAAIPLPNRKGKLILVGDYAEGSQWQPPQLAARNVMVTPVLPEGAQAFEITPGEVKVLEPLREVGGRRFKIEDFGGTALILATTDMALYEQVRAMVDAVKSRAVPLAIEQAELKLKAVREIHTRLAADGHDIRSEDDVKERQRVGIESRPTDANDLLAKAEEYIKSARDAWEQGDFAWAWAEARRASRPLRVLMHGHWLQANLAVAKAADKFYPKRPKPAPGEPKRLPDPPLLLTAVSCPPLISFESLTDAYLWADWIAGRPGYAFGANRVPTGDFDNPGAVTQNGWLNVGYQMEGIKTKVSFPPYPRDPKRPKEVIKPGARVLQLDVTAEKQEDLDTLLPGYLDFPVAAVRSPPFHLEANNLARISVLVKRPFQSAPGLGGIVVRDSIGGELLQYRTSAPIPGWSRVMLFRKAPADGDYTVMLGLAGYGEVMFDDFRVEVIEEAPRAGDPDVAEADDRAPRTPEANPPRATTARSTARPSASRIER